MIRRWLFGDESQIPHWTPRRAHQAEIATLRAQGVVIEPHFLWSRPAQERERVARQRRMQASAWQPTGKAIRERRGNIREMRRESSR